MIHRFHADRDVRNPVIDLLLCTGTRDILKHHTSGGAHAARLEIRFPEPTDEPEEDEIPAVSVEAVQAPEQVNVYALAENGLQAESLIRIDNKKPRVCLSNQEHIRGFFGDMKRCQSVKNRLVRGGIPYQNPSEWRRPS